ncbi:MAG: spore cortex biosynthesis protein YabQ [Kyrpidia sp.]|nr:spore cortex biosynthesis protein YabQ [Kyrpidia sp.]
MPVQGQWMAVVALAGCGAALGAGYDLYNTILRGRREWRWVFPFADLAFWAAALAGVFRLLLVTVDGEMRLSFLAVMGLGFGLYRIWVHAAVVRSAQWVAGAVTYCIRLGRRLWNALIRRPVAAGCRLLLAALEGILRILGFFENMILWPLGPVIGWVQKRAEDRGEAERPGRDDEGRSWWKTARRWLFRRLGRKE